MPVNDTPTLLSGCPARTGKCTPPRNFEELFFVVIFNEMREQSIFKNIV
jgi:hypothetical protein